MTNWTNQAKNNTSWDDGVDFLLQEIGDFLLLETGEKIVLNQSTNAKYNPAWSNQTKN